jgi:hypothetical protein
MQPAAVAASDSAPATVEDLKAQVAHQQAVIEQQQKQLDQLRQSIEEQRRLLERISSSLPAAPAPAATAARPLPSLGQVATTTPMAPAAAPRAVTAPQQGASSSASSPLQLQIGNTTLMPVGFMDATAVWRDKNAGSSIGSNFGSVPYGNTTAGHLTEFRFSPQNSRLGFRVDGDWKGNHFIGYNEFDFLGTSGSNTIGVTNGAFVPRLRLFWVDVHRGKFEILGGQSWSMLTPNRKGISPLPGDIFFSQTIDVNYMAGLTWTRQPGFRFLYHPSDTVTMGVSLEDPNQYMGGSAGGGQITLPSGLTALAGGQLDNGTAAPLSTPNLHPDIIAKVAFDPNAHAHIEIAGIERTFKVVNPSTFKTSTIAGGGVSLNANFEVVKNFRLVTNNFWSDGGGRYLFGQAPDVIVQANGRLSGLHSGGTVDGFEATIKKFLLYGYYGGIYIGRNVAVDTNGNLVGYGYHGAPNSQNRSIQEATIGFNQTIWKDAKYGAVNFMGQYEYLFRNPWFVAANAPKSAHDNTIYVNLRYTLPGAPPTSGR